MSGGVVRWAHAAEKDVGMTMARTSEQMELVFAGIGTKGDVFPLLGLGEEMARRGHACQLLANAPYGELARRHGMGFTPVTVEQSNNLVSGRENFEHHVFPSYAPTFEYFRERMALGRRLTVINLDEYSASNLMCELYSLPLCRIHLAPHSIKSVLRPPWPHNKKLEGPLSATYRRYRLPQIYKWAAESPYVVSRINEYRRELGMAPIMRTDASDALVGARLGFFPRWYAEPAADWPERLELVGFPLARSSAPLPAELTAFIEREGAPLVFTPGTGVSDVRRFFEDARHCCEVLGWSGVFLSPHFRMPSGGLGPRILHRDFIELEPLLRRARLLVHHGGIGTTARALQAGVPQIIRAVTYDQPDNGDRVTALGVGRLFFERPDLDNDKLIEAVRFLTGERAVERQLERIHKDIASTDAIVQAADYLEATLLARSGGARAPGSERRVPVTAGRAPCAKPQPSISTNRTGRAAEWVRIGHAGAIFERIADVLVARVRRAMAVPVQAEQDVESEFAALRARLDEHYPAYDELFARLLAAHLGPDRADGVMESLRSEALQRYLVAAPAIEADLQRGLHDLTRRMELALSGTRAA
jgi:rhamnosyltransferase subunit B